MNTEEVHDDLPDRKSGKSNTERRSKFKVPVGKSTQKQLIRET